MWIVRLALKRPYTFTVMALLILLLGIVTVRRMAKDIFPSIDIPVVTVLWVYNGLPADEIEKRIITISERAMTTTVNDIEHIESQSYTGVGVIKVFFHPNASIDAAVSQVTAINQTIVRVLPPGATPPLVIRFSASNVPILQLGLGSQTISEQGLYDIALNFLRTQLATVQGASVPLPYGGKVRQVQIDLNPSLLQAYGVTPAEVSNAINAQNLTLPSGTAKIGEREYGILLNSSPDTIAGLGDLPVKVVKGSTVYVRDVAQVRDGFAPQVNIVRQNGNRGALVTIQKNGGASTLDIIDRVKETLPKILATLPPELQVTPLLDQSIFVRHALDDVFREALTATVLTGLMILLFLGSWRSTLVVAISIPLSIFCSILCLSAFGQTINSMTLGGLALAVGILVDDATVEIENIDRNLGMRKPLIQAILDGAQQIALPAFVSTLCICIVFVPIFFLDGTAKYLFGPMAMAVIFAMLASYFLSRTVVPTFIHFLLMGQAAHDPHAPATGFFGRIHQKFNEGFEALRVRYSRALGWSLDHKKLVAAIVFGTAVATACFVPFLGRDFFPTVDAGQFRLHVRAPVGTRIEETERLFTRVENVIREVIPAKEVAAVLDNIGLPGGGTSLAFSDTATLGAFDGEILVSLTPEHKSTWKYVRELRKRFAAEFPECTFFTQPSDIVGQILNFGLPAPIDIQITGRDRAANYAIAQEISNRVSKIRGAVDVHVHQIVNSPALKIDVDRTRAEGFGLTQRDVAGNLLISLSGSGQTAPNYWLSPQNGVQYSVATQTPQYRIDSVDTLYGTPIGTDTAGQPQQLSNVATVQHAVMPAVAGHYNVQPVYDVYANVDERDLGGVSDEVNKIVKEFQTKLPRGSTIVLRGQVQSMNTSFFDIGVGLIFAIFLVYLLLVVNFQSWLDPFIIITALVGALTGIVWTLVLTPTTLSVPSLMGAIMCVGVATANSILVVTFANDRRKEGDNAREAAYAAGTTRLRPVMMTALAMIIGMLPMSLGIGEGGEQNAPLGRAVIGGLLVATVATLFFVPVVYAALRGKAAHRPEETVDEEMDQAHLPH